MGKLSNTKNFLYGSITIAFTLVLTQTWVSVIKDTSVQFTTKIRCDKIKMSKDNYNNCVNNHSLLSNFFSAIITTIIIIILAFLFFKLSKYDVTIQNQP